MEGRRRICNREGHAYNGVDVHVLEGQCGLVEEKREIGGGRWWKGS